MSQPAKYLFDNVFENGNYPSEKEPSAAELEQARIEEELEAARQRSYEEGYEAGQQDAIDTLETRISKSMETILARFDQAVQDFDGTMKRGRGDAIEIASAVATKLCQDFNEQDPLKGLLPFLEKTLIDIRTEPQLVIYVAEEVVAEVEARMMFVRSAAGFNGSLSIKGREGLTAQDAVVEWRDGQVAYTPSALGEFINDLVGAYVARESDRDGEADISSSSGELHE